MFWRVVEGEAKWSRMVDSVHGEKAVREVKCSRTEDDNLRNSETSKSDTSTGTRGLVHLTEDQCDLGLTVKLNDGGLLHFLVQIVTLTGTLTDTGEDGETTVGLGDVVLLHC
jgi:hypothetical protein